MLKKIVRVLSGLILLVLLVLIGAYYYFLIRPLPLTDGELRIKSLESPVRVYRDQWGLPHIYAESRHDLFMAQGFVQAQDRLWQMETNRRVAAGRLSEILGADFVDLDRDLRTLGFMRAAVRELAATDEAGLEILRAFAQGVNAWIDLAQDRLPFEFQLLRFKPEPWRPEDSLAWLKFMAFSGGNNWEEELVQAMLVQKLGEVKAKDLLGLNKLTTPSIIPSGLPVSALSFFSPSGTPLPFGFRGASNNWTVHGSRTASGRPLLANDMHLPVEIPSVWYENHLSSGEFDVIGLSLPGVPLVVAGHNRDIAWGITFAYTDVQDVFLEKMNHEQRGEYLYQGEYLQAKRIREPIKVRGQDLPIVHEVWETIHGTVVTPMALEARLGYSLALKWTASEPGQMMTAMQALNLARNWEEFKSAALNWSEPAVNLVYADRSGNIGYVLAARTPLRPQGHGRGPFPGWTGEHDWTGYLPPDQKPILFNPARGFIVTANNRVAGPDYPHYLSDDYASGFRAARIEQVLSQQDKASPAIFRELQGDLKCLPAARFISALKNIKGESPAARDLLSRLRAWDQILDADSVGGAVYSVLFYRLLENTFRDELGPTADRFFGRGFISLSPLTRYVEHSRTILLNLMSEPGSSWFDDINTPVRENLSDMVEKSLNETAAFLKERLGPEPEDWRWGRLHRIKIEHPLGEIKPLGLLLNLGSFEGGGHLDTVWQSAVRPGMDFDLKDWTASNRHIYDLSDWDRSLGAIVPGQSGMRGSSHYDDQMEMWLRVEHHPLFYSRSKVEENAEAVLILKPPEPGG